MRRFLSTIIIKIFFVIPVLLLLNGCSGGKRGEVYKKQDYGKKWPFSTDEIDVYCAGYREVYFVSEGEVYALNGEAQGAAKSGRSAETNKTFKELWLDDPDVSGIKITIPSEFIENALEKCP